MQGNKPIDYPSSGYAWLIVAILFLAYVSSFIDRMILSLMVGPIKADLGVTDTQIGLLQGFAFVILYTLLGLPIGRLVDHYSRLRIVAVGVTIWSVMTAACGFAASYFQLFLARIGVGVGEATLSPAAYSLISDSFPKERLGLAMGVYNLGSAIGGGLAMIIGGMVVSFIMKSGSLTVPLLGEIAAWKATFFVVGVPGLLIAGIVALLREPTRQDGAVAGADTKRAQHGAGEHLPLGRVLAFMKSHALTLFYHHAGVAVGNLGLVAAVYWAAPFYTRVHGWSIRDAGLIVGLSLILGGLLGLVGGGWVGDLVTRRYPNTGRFRVCVATCLISAPCAIVFALADSPYVAAGFFMLVFAGMVSPVSNAVALLQQMTPNRMRGFLSAFYLFVVNLIGMGIGTFVIGFLNDNLFPDPDGVRYSLAIVVPVAAIVAALLFRLAFQPYRDSLARVAASQV